MKRQLLFLMALTISITLSAQISFNTGGVAFSTDLNEINAQAQLDFGKFKVDIAGSYNIDENRIEYMSAELSMDAAEIYLACEIGRVADKNIDEVIVVYTSSKSKGWGYIAKQLGIAPGSDEFHALKKSTDSYYHENEDTNKKSKGKGKSKNKK